MKRDHMWAWVTGRTSPLPPQLGLFTLKLTGRSGLILVMLSASKTCECELTEYLTKSQNLLYLLKHESYICKSFFLATNVTDFFSGIVIIVGS